MNFKKFNAIGDSEPKAWKRSSAGTKFGVDEDEEDEIPVPYCDEDDELEEEDTTEEEDEELDEIETETETESITSVQSKKRNNKKMPVLPKCSIILQEETDFMPE